MVSLLEYILPITHHPSHTMCLPRIKDPYVYIWDFNQENLTSPTWRFTGPRVSLRPSQRVTYLQWFIAVWLPVKCFHSRFLCVRSIRVLVRSSPGSALLCHNANQLISSGDTRDIIYQYDLSHLSSPVAQTQGGPNSPCRNNMQHDVRPLLYAYD